jgi:hypothetical protein
MSRRSTPERLDAARHAAVRNSLIGEGATPETADAWLAAWEAEAAQDGLERGTAYWQARWDWIAEQRQHRVRPA